MEALFYDKDNQGYTVEDIYHSLREIGAHDCDALFLHSDIMFGRISGDFKRKKYLAALTEVIERLKVKYLIVPTFTYSFCNQEDFDVSNSRTSMGALNEYLRKLPGRYRTHDPLLSLSIPEELKERFVNLSEFSLGGCGLDRIHHMDGVKFLFFGVSMSTCFTYVHYVEKMMEVPYRFDMPFTGTIIDEDGRRSLRKQYIHTACYGVKPAEYDYFEDYLQEKGDLRKMALGDKTVSCISEKDAYKEIKGMIEHNIHYFLEQPFREEDLVHKYTMGLHGERITHC